MSSGPLVEVQGPNLSPLQSAPVTAAPSQSHLAPPATASPTSSPNSSLAITPTASGGVNKDEISIKSGSGSKDVPVIGVPSKDRKVQKIEKKEQKKEQKLVRKSNAEEVAAWLLDLGLPRQTAEKYLKLFEEEEIFTLAQVKQLTSQHLHDWMGVKTGTVLLMLEAIQDLEIPQQESVRAALRNQKVENLAKKVTGVGEGVHGSESSDEGSAANPKLIKKLEREQKKAEKEAKKLEKKQPLPREDSEGPKSPRLPSDVPKIITEADAKDEEEEEMFQAGGHGEVERFKERPGIVRKRTDKAECEFYAQLAETELIPPHIKTFFARLDSLQKEKTGIGSRKFVLMEDLTWGYKRPCIMDVKMGTRTAGYDANLVKKKYMISKDVATTTALMGMRIVALRKFDVILDDFVSLTRSECNNIATESHLERNLMAFFHTGASLRLDVLQHMVQRLRFLLDWLQSQTSYRFFSSSLLFIYEGDTNEEFKADVRMIDFAHVFEIKDGGIDDGYVKGLTHLLGFLEKFHDYPKKLAKPQLGVSAEPNETSSVEDPDSSEVSYSTEDKPAYGKEKEEVKEVVKSIKARSPLKRATDLNTKRGSVHLEESPSGRSSPKPPEKGKKEPKKEVGLGESDADEDGLGRRRTKDRGSPSLKESPGHSRAGSAVAVAASTSSTGMTGSGGKKRGNGEKEKDKDNRASSSSTD